MLTDKEIVVYLNDADTQNVYRNGVSLVRLGTSGNGLPSERRYAPTPAGSAIRSPDPRQNPVAHDGGHPRPGHWHRRQQRDVHAGQRAAHQARVTPLTALRAD